MVGGRALRAAASGAGGRRRAAGGWNLARAEPSPGSGGGRSRRFNPAENARITRLFAALSTALARGKCEFVQMEG